MSNFDETKHPRGHASNPGAFSGKDNSGPDAVLGTAPPVYDPADQYYTRLDAVRDPRATAETLARVIEHESEDDFHRAVATHPNASAATLGKAARHSSFWVREAVVATPHTTLGTLTAIRETASSTSDRAAADLRHQGVNPGNQQLKWEIESADRLVVHCDLAVARLASRWAGHAVVTDIGIHRERREVDKLLDGLRGLGGEPLSDEARSRVQSLCARPTEQSWAEAKRIMVDGTTTLWQTVRRRSRAGRPAGPEDVPDRADVIAALTGAIAPTTT